jgi:hypothetical protein
LSLFANRSVRRFTNRGHDLGTIRDLDGAPKTLVYGQHEISPRLRIVGRPGSAALWTGIVKNADDGWVSSGENTGNPSGTAPVPPWSGFVNKHQIALHGPVDVARRDKDVAARASAGWGAVVGPHKAEAIAVKIQAPADQPVSTRARFVDFISRASGRSDLSACRAFGPGY